MKISVRDKDNDLLKPLEIITLKGDKGDKGDKSIYIGSLDTAPESADVIFDNSDLDVITEGVTPNIQIGEVITVEADEPAAVIRKGTNKDPIFDFKIPRGRNGIGSSSSISIDDSSISKDKTWSSSKIEDFTLTNVGAIWKEINGEAMVIDNVMEGCLREVEIWGNSIQNEDNLSDIQHLGELYTDNTGKEQYKIEVTSSNFLNLYYPTKSNGKINAKLVYASNLRVVNGVFEFLPETHYQTMEVEVDHFKDKYGKSLLRLNEVHKIKFEVLENSTSNTQIQIQATGIFSGFSKTLSVGETGVFEYSKKITNIPNESIHGSGQLFKIMTGGATDGILKIKVTFGVGQIDKPKSYKSSLLLPCQLMKVGDISDRLYWDNNEGRYIIEKNIVEEFIPKDFKNITSSMAADFGGGLKYVTLSNALKNNYPFFPAHINNLCTMSNPYENTKKGMGILQRHIRIRLEDNKDTTVEDMSNKLQEINGLRVYLKDPTPELIDTDIREEIKLPTFMNNTYVTVNGGIQGSIKAKAPVDGGKVIGVLESKNKELETINNIQDELINTTLLATDKMYTMLEPLLANMLVDNETNNPLIDMYVVMIQRGLLKTIEQVPEKYRQQVEDIMNNKGGK